MAYVPVPKDMNAVKTKVAFNLTKRQIVCFGGGLLVGLPVFFLIKGHVSNSITNWKEAKPGEKTVPVHPPVGCR